MAVSSYAVKWRARGIDFNYSGTKKVYAFSESDAKEKALEIVSRKMVLAVGLIDVISVTKS